MTNKEWTQRGEKVLMNTYNRGEKVLVEGKGVYVKDSEGTEYLDFVSGIAVNSLGHQSAELINALNTQSQKLMHTSNLYWNTPSIEAAEKLCKLSGLDKVFFSNSGAEANEAAIKLARKWGRETKGEAAVEIITLKQSFHGRTLATLAATGQENMHVDFAPTYPGFSYSEINDSKGLENLVSANTCALIVEVVQGEGGVHALSEKFIKTIQTVQQTKNVLLIIDEVQTGIGRLGTMFGFQQFALDPDIITLAKGLGGGFPIGATLAKDSVASHFKVGDHGSTFGGNPLATAVANAVLDTIAADNLLKNVQERSQQLEQGLLALKETNDSIVNVRVFGLLAGIELNRDVQPIIEKCFENKLLVLSAKGNVIRFLPPLNVTEAEINQALELFSNSLS